MRSAPFVRREPLNADEACAELAELTAAGVRALPLAGGQSLVPLLHRRELRPEVLVDLNRIDALAAVRFNRNWVEIGAMTRQQTLERSVLIRRRVPLLSAAAARIGHPQVRSRGTVGGSLALGAAFAELPAAALVLDADVQIRGVQGERRMPAAELWGREQRCPGPSELITMVRFRIPPQGSGHGLQQTAARLRDPACAGAMVLLTVRPDGRCDRVRVALMGIGAGPVRAVTVEAAMLDQVPTDDHVAAASRAVTDDLPVAAASGSYAARVIGPLVQRSLLEARAGISRPVAEEVPTCEEDGE